MVEETLIFDESMGPKFADRSGDAKISPRAASRFVHIERSSQQRSQIRLPRCSGDQYLPPSSSSPKANVVLCPSNLCGRHKAVLVAILNRYQWPPCIATIRLSPDPQHFSLQTTAHWMGRRR